jgi:hypothetical protein
MIVSGLDFEAVTVGRGIGTLKECSSKSEGVHASTCEENGKVRKQMAAFVGIGRMAPIWCMSEVGEVRKAPRSHQSPSLWARSNGLIRDFCRTPMNQTGEANVRTGRTTVL